MSPIATFSLLGQKRYWPIWAGQVLGAFNDNLFRYALVTMAAFQGLTVLGRSPEEMAPIAATAFTLPLFVFSAVAGQIADKFDRMKLKAAAALGVVLQPAAHRMAGRFSFGLSQQTDSLARASLAALRAA